MPTKKPLYKVPFKFMKRHREDCDKLETKMIELTAKEFALNDMTLSRDMMKAGLEKEKEDHKETNNNYIALLKKFMEPVTPKDEAPPISAIIETKTPTKDKLVRSVCKPKSQETLNTPVVKLEVNSDWGITDSEYSEFMKGQPGKQSTHQEA